MSPENRDASCLWDMRKHALEIKEIMKGIPRTKFVQNKTIRYAVERLLLIIGGSGKPCFNEISRRTSRN
jgi:uncharacterized protein with HEPN domain